MRTFGWISVLLGALGALCCIAAVLVLQEVGENVKLGTSKLALHADELLQRVDRTLEAGTATAAEVIAQRDGPEVGRRLEQLEGALERAMQTGTSALRMLEVASRLRDDTDGDAGEAGFPGLRAALEGIFAAHTVVEKQRENLSEWGPQAQALDETIATARERVAEARDHTGVIAATARDRLDTLLVLLTAFLVWMGAGQVALVVLGRRTARGSA